MLSKKTRYAIKALIYIAKNDNGMPISVSKISVAQKIPLKFLESILTELKNARILNSRKGKFGGYVLNVTSDEINLARIMRLFDGPIALLSCVSENFYERCDGCIDEETCAIRQIALEIKNETVSRLKEATLANIIKREK